MTSRRKQLDELLSTPAYQANTDQARAELECLLALAMHMRQLDDHGRSEESARHSIAIVQRELKLETPMLISVLNILIEESVELGRHLRLEHGCIGPEHERP